MTPQTQAELAEIIAGADGPLQIQGGATRGVSGPGAALSVAGISGITLYEPGALTLVARAGTPLAEIEASLRAEGQRLAFEPMDHRVMLGGTGEPTIGGVVAANVSGPRRISVGACRDHALGVTYVDGTGQVIKNGGRVMKNVTGYDLVKLMAGSWGTLGVLSDVSLKVLPVAETEQSLAIEVADAAQAVAVLSSALGSPFEVTGAAYDPAQGVALVRIEGFEASVAYRAEQLCRLLGGFGAVSRVAGDPLWAEIRDCAALAGQAGDIWRVSVKPTDAPELTARMEAAQLLFDWGGGLIWARVPAGTDLRARLGEFAGHATLIRAGAQTKARLGMFQPEPPALAALSAALRARFDPRGVFQPGLMG